MGVRKRVLKLFKTLYSATSDRMRRIDMCNRIVQRMGDEDDTVKDLAMKTLEELWFTDTLGSSAQSAIPPIDSDKSHLLMKVSIIMGTAACFKDRNSPLEDLLHKLITQKETADSSNLHTRYSEICEVLIDGLVDASDLPGFVRHHSTSRRVHSPFFADRCQLCQNDMLVHFSVSFSPNS